MDGRTEWREGSHLTITRAAVEIQLFRRLPSRELIEAVRSAPVRFMWVDSPGVAMVRLFFSQQERPHESAWFDIIYTPRTEMIGRGRPPGVPGQPITVVVTLVDAATGRVAAVRTSTWPVEDSDFVRARLEGELAKDSSPSAERAFIHSVRGGDMGFAHGRAWFARS
ncbi:hypothetical protein [Actinomadura kijaniata]|uniref:hypothetical protein n=1 Tax=Actinomadura kijaniata TaxID=46161 RepID=UPI0012FA4C4B|nr:hypothetical protein [Actinomadura kijaniata]